MAGVDDSMVYVQTVVKVQQFVFSPPPGLGTRKNREMAGGSSRPAISLFFLGPNPVVVYIYGVPIIHSLIYSLLIPLRSFGTHTKFDTLSL